MGIHKWSDLMKKRYSPEQIAESRANAVKELQRVYVTGTEFRVNLSKILDRVAKTGKPVVIMRRALPVVAIVSLADFERLESAAPAKNHTKRRPRLRRS